MGIADHHLHSIDPDRPASRTSPTALKSPKTKRVLINDPTNESSNICNYSHNYNVTQREQKKELLVSWEVGQIERFTQHDSANQFQPALHSVRRKNIKHSETTPQKAQGTLPRWSTQKKPNLRERLASCSTDGRLIEVEDGNVLETQHESNSHKWYLARI